MTRVTLAVMCLLLTASLCLSEERAPLRIPEPPFVEKGIPAGAVKAEPAVGKDGVEIGDKFLRVSGGSAYTAFFHRGQQMFSMEARMYPAPKWYVLKDFTTALDEARKVITNECPYDMMENQKGVFRERVEVTPEGKIAMTFLFDMPEGMRGKTKPYFNIAIPTTALLGQKVQYNDREVFTLPEDVKEYVKFKIPEKAAIVGQPKRIAFFVDKPEKAFSLEFPPEVKAIIFRRSESGSGVQVCLREDAAHKPFTITLDPGNCYENAATDCIVGGINVTQTNGYEAAVFDEKKNVFMNPSFESGMRYWKKDPGHGRLEEMFCTTDAHSGKHSFHILGEGALSNAGVIQTVGTIVYPDTEYTLSAWVKSPDGKPAGMGIHPRGHGGPANWGKWGGVKTSEPHDQWQRVHYTFRSPKSNYLDIWFTSHNNGILIDDLQLEQGAAMTEYAGNKIGLELLTDSPDGCVVDADAPINARLVFRGEPGQTGSADVTVTDFADQELLKKSLPFRIGKAGEQVIPLGPDSLFPKGTNIIKVVVKADGQKEYTDFLRLTRFKYADGTAKHKAIHGQGLPFFHRYGDKRSRLHKYVGIGAASSVGKVEGRLTKEEHALFDKYGIEDFWGGFLWNTNWKQTLNGRPWEWKGRHPLAMESYPPEFLKWVEDMAYEQTKANPWVPYWSFEREPAGRYATLKQGNMKEYAKLVLAANRGVMRANPDAMFSPYNSWNMFAQGRSEVCEFLRCAKELEPKTDFKVIDIHTYRSFPENPDIEEDLLAFMEGLRRAGYPDIKIAIGEGAYYYPMIAPEAGDLAPWAGVFPKDMFGGIMIPSYDLGWGERIGAAQVIRELLVYYKHADRVINSCPWVKPLLDNGTVVSWAVASAALTELLGNADFVKNGDIRFAIGSRAYLFEDPQKRTIAAVWRFDEKFDRGQAEATTMAMKFPEGVKPEFIDMMGNVCNVPIKDGKYQVPLSGFPVYIRVAPGQGAALSKAISECEVEADEKGLPLQFVATIKNRTEALVSVINQLSRELRADVGIAGAAMSSVTAAPKSTTSVAVKLPKPLSDKTFDQVEIPIAVRYQGRDFKEDFKATALAVHHVGDRFSWKDVPSVPVPYRHSVPGGNVDKDHKWSGPADLSATCQFAWNEKNLYMRYVVNDDRFVCPEKGTNWGNYWNYDSIQLFFDSFCDAKANAKKNITGFDTNDFSYELLPESSTSAVVYRRIAPDRQLTGGVYGFDANVLEKSISCKFRYANGRRIYEAVFPASSLMPIPLKEGSTFGFGFEIYDRDTPKAGAPQKLSNVRTTAYRNPHEYPQLILVK